MERDGEVRPRQDAVTGHPREPSEQEIEEREGLGHVVVESGLDDPPGVRLVGPERSTAAGSPFSTSTSFDSHIPKPVSPRIAHTTSVSRMVVTNRS